MGALEAAERVLHDAGQPLRPEELTRRMLQTGLWSSGGKTPDKTVSAELYKDIQRRGSASCFQLTGSSGRANFGHWLTSSVSGLPRLMQSEEAVISRASDSRAPTCSGWPPTRSPARRAT